MPPRGIDAPNPSAVPYDSGIIGYLHFLILRFLIYFSRIFREKAKIKLK